MKAGKESLMIGMGASIKYALEEMGKSGEKCLLIVENNQKLKGVVSDGDIRRAILNGYSLVDPIDSIVNTTPAVLAEGAINKTKLQEVFIKERISVVPVVDAHSIVKDILLWEDVFEEAPVPTQRYLGMPVVIMAGGEGTRLAPFTKILPKPLIPVNDKPVIEHIVDRFVDAGADQFFVTVKYKSRILRAFFEELSPSYEIEFFEEQEPLGTVGGVGLISDKIRTPFIVTNCDVIVDIDYAACLEFHRERQNAITLVASAKDYTVPYGVCELDGDGYLAEIKEKPSFHFLINVGLYVIEPIALDLIPRGRSYDITDLLSDAKKKHLRIGVFPVGDVSWFDIGQWKEYRDTLKLFRQASDLSS